MQPSQVLNEEQRGERFASSLQRKRALNADDDSDDEIGVDPITADTSVQDPSFQEAEVMISPKVEPNLLVPSYLNNLSFFTSTGAAPRHLCTPPPLMPNNSLGFKFTLPPNLPPFNLQSALIQKYQYNLARWQSHNPATSHSNALTQNAFSQYSSIQTGFTQSGLTQNGLISYPSISNGLHTFAQAAHHNRVRSTKSSSSSNCPNRNLRFFGGNKWLRGPPPLMEKPCSNFPSASYSSSSLPGTNHSKVHAKEVSPRLSVIWNSKRPIEETNSNTRYEDPMETRDTFDFANTDTTYTTTVTTTFASSMSTFCNRTPSQEHPLKNSSLGGAGNLNF